MKFETPEFEIKTEGRVVFENGQLAEVSGFYAVGTPADLEDYVAKHYRFLPPATKEEIAARPIWMREGTAKEIADNVFKTWVSNRIASFMTINEGTEMLPLLIELMEKAIDFAAKGGVTK